MKELAGRLTALDPDAGAAVRVIAYFDRLTESRAGVEALVRGAAVLAGCPARLVDPERRVHVRVETDGTRRDTEVPPDPTWPSARLAPDGAAILWLERAGTAPDGTDPVRARARGAGVAEAPRAGSGPGGDGPGPGAGDTTRARTAPGADATDRTRTAPDADTDRTRVASGDVTDRVRWTPGERPDGRTVIALDPDATDRPRVAPGDITDRVQPTPGKDHTDRTLTAPGPDTDRPPTPFGVYATDRTPAPPGPDASGHLRTVPGVDGAGHGGIAPSVVDAVILERAARALRVVLDRTRGRAPADDPALVETLLDATAPESARLHAARRLGLDLSAPARALAALNDRPRVVTDGTAPDPAGRLGVGPAVPVLELPASWAAARTALRFTAEGTPQDPGPRIVHADELGGIALLADLVAPGAEPPPDVRALETAAAATPWLSETLHAVASTGSLRAAAAGISIHHSTLQDRLAHAEHLLGWSVRTPQGRLRLQLALAMRHLARP